MIKLLLPLLALLLLPAAAQPAPAASPPNILLIVSDDQRPDTIHALGNPAIRTPNLDGLVTRGTAFTRAFATYPICYASRAELLTGCPAFRALATYPSGGVIRKDLATLGATFQAAGYSTWYSGKWHNGGHPHHHGYTATRALFSSGGAKNAPPPGFDSRGNAITGYRGWTFKSPNNKPELDKGIGLTPRTSEHIADGAIAALRDTAADKPFLLHVNFAAPHDPRILPPGPEHVYNPAKIDLPGSFAPQHPFDHGNLEGRDEKLLTKPLQPADVRTELAIYYSVISDMDHHIGRILAALEAQGRFDNTLIIFTSDQGLALGSHGLLGKQNMYQHTVTVPFILAGPGVPAKARQPALTCLYDLFPTLCQLAHIPVPNTVQGRSLAPVLAGTRSSVRDFVTAYFTDTQRMIFDGRWKYAVYPKAGREQLFDLQSDPRELHSLSADAAHRQTADRLRQQLRDWCLENGDTLLQ